jgi:hypothetical protein
MKILNIQLISRSNNNIRISLFLAPTQVRFAHTDVQVPDFSAYRRDSTQRPSSKAQSAEERKAFSYALVGGELLHLFHN